MCRETEEAAAAMSQERGARSWTPGVKNRPARESHRHDRESSFAKLALGMGSRWMSSSVVMGCLRIEG